MGLFRGAGARVGALSPLAQPVTVIVGVGGAQGVPEREVNPAKEQSPKSRPCWECLMFNGWNYLCYQCQGFVSRLGTSVPPHALEYPMEVYFPRSLRGF